MRSGAALALWERRYALRMVCCDEAQSYNAHIYYFLWFVNYPLIIIWSSGSASAPRREASSSRSRMSDGQEKQNIRIELLKKSDSDVEGVRTVDQGNPHAFLTETSSALSPCKAATANRREGLCNSGTAEQWRKVHAHMGKMACCCFKLMNKIPAWTPGAIG